MGEPNVADRNALLSALDEALAVMQSVDAQFLIMGGIASGILGRSRGTRDVDLFVRPEDLSPILEGFQARNFRTEVVYPHWLAKATNGDVTVDIIFRSSRDILLDDEMLRRGVTMNFHGRSLRLVPPEDLFVMKALAASEDTPRYWYDALSIVGHSELDWDYLVRRARASGVSRVLSALLYARSNDLTVPTDPLRVLFALALEGRHEGTPSPPATGSDGSVGGSHRLEAAG
jgi:predicted nucleotidyltransferase